MSNLLDRIPTNSGNKTPDEIITDLLYICYATQIDHGMQHSNAARLFNLNFETARMFWHMYIFKEFREINHKN
jgi:hypothetical protein